MEPLKDKVTQPTQAQIEAAAKAIHALELEHGYVTREWRGIEVETEYAAMAKAALSEVDKIEKDPESPTFGKDGQAAAAAIRKLKDAP